MNPSELPQILSGDGDSPETAAKFEFCHVRDRVGAEEEFICERFGTEHIHWVRGMHYTSFDFQSVWVITFDDGTERSVYFETKGTIYDEA